MKIKISDLNQSIQAKLKKHAEDWDSGKRRSMYSDLTEYESQHTDHGYKWKYGPDTDILREKFLFEIFPLAEYKGDLDVRRISYMDQSFFSDYFVFYDRAMASGYTEHGVHRIDSYFCNRIRNMTTMEEADEIERMIYLCPNLHICIKHNLIFNLFNYAEELCQQN